MNNRTCVGYVLAVAHCVINQTTRWFWKNSGGWVEGFVAEIFEKLKPLGIGLYQLPCPEFSFLGNPRKPMTKEEYEALPGFVEHCGRLAEQAVADLKSFEQMARPKVRVLAVIGMEGSPSCGVQTTSKRVSGKSVRVAGMGVFMEILKKHMTSENVDAAFYGLDLRRVDESVSEIVKALTRRVKALEPL